MAAKGLSVLILWAVAALSDEVSDTTLLSHQLTGTTLPIGCKFWRVRSITDTSGDWWQIKELEFYSSVDGAGRKLEEKRALASSYKKGGDTYKPEKAIDNSGETFWSAANKYKYEWIGVEFEEPQEVGSVKMQLVDWQFGPAMVVVEKSLDGEWWSRSTEISDMKDWATDMQLYPLIQMTTVPPSVFAFRSQEDPHFCLGVRTTSMSANSSLPASEQGDPVDICDFARLEVQVCDSDRTTQYWALDEGARPMLRNAQDQTYVMHVNGSTSDKTELSVRQCIDGCADGFEDDVWEYVNDAGGIIRNKNQPHLLAFPKGGQLTEGTVVALEMCGAEGDTALFEDCESKVHTRFELLPMFVLEQGVQTVSCAPYSHSSVEPAVATSRIEAQEICAKDSTCAAYNWVDSTAAGDVTDKVYACTAMHEVHSGVAGWELGVRAGRLDVGDDGSSLLDAAQSLAHVEL